MMNVSQKEKIWEYYKKHKLPKVCLETVLKNKFLFFRIENKFGLWSKTVFWEFVLKKDYFWE